MIAGFSIYYLLSIFLLIALLWGGMVVLLKKRQIYRKEKKSLTRLNIGLAVCFVLLLLVFAEFAFAVLYVQTDAFNMTNSSKRWFHLYIENQRNEFGARDKEEFVRKLPKGEKRICFIGDSFTVGHGIKNIENRFSNLIEKKLNEQYPGVYHVSNLSDPGLELVQIEGRARGILHERYQVDQIVYVMCLNDIEGFDKIFQEKLKKLGGAGFKNFILKYSYLPNWLYFRYLQFSRKEVHDYYPHLAKSYESIAWTSFSRKLKDFVSLCQTNDVKFNVVIFPFLHDLKDDSSFVAVHQKVKKFCEQNQIHVVDLEPVMREHAEENLVVNRFDAHPNEKANAYAAEAIYKELFEKNNPNTEIEPSSDNEDSK